MPNYDLEPLKADMQLSGTKIIAHVFELDNSRLSNGFHIQKALENVPTETIKAAIGKIEDFARDSARAHSSGCKTAIRKLQHIVTTRETSLPPAIGVSRKEKQELVTLSENTLSTLVTNYFPEITDNIQPSIKKGQVHVNLQPPKAAMKKPFEAQLEQGVAQMQNDALSKTEDRLFNALLHLLQQAVEQNRGDERYR